MQRGLCFNEPGNGERSLQGFWFKCWKLQSEGNSSNTQTISVIFRVFAFLFLDAQLFLDFFFPVFFSFPLAWRFLVSKYVSEWLATQYNWYLENDLCFVSCSESCLIYLSWVKHAFRVLQSLPWSKNWGLFSWCTQAPINTRLTSYKLWVQLCCRLLVWNKPLGEIRHVIFPVVFLLLCQHYAIIQYYSAMYSQEWKVSLHFRFQERDRHFYIIQTT